MKGTGAFDVGNRVQPLLAVMVAVLMLFGTISPGVAQTADDGRPEDRAEVLTDRLLASLDGAAPEDRIDVIVETTVPSDHAADEARALGHEVVWTYSIIDAYAAQLQVADLHELGQQPWVDAVWDARPLQPLLETSTQVVRADHAWDAGITGEGVSVAVIDTGVDVTDPFVAGNLDISACYAFLAGVQTPECLDTDGHGTHVAGIVASDHDTYTGVAPDASIAAFRVLHGGAGLATDKIAAMDWIVENPDAVTPAIEVINLSLGPLNPGCGDGTSPSAQAVDAAVEAGLTVVVAAGNDGHDECTVDASAAAVNAITVGSVDDQDTEDRDDVELAESSSAGPTEDNRTKPEVVAPGVGVTSLFPGPFVATISGTSMAAPHVAGAAALVHSAHDDVDPKDLRHLFMDTAYTPPNAPDTLPTCGTPWGWGLLDIDAALTAIDQNSWQTPTEPCEQETKEIGEGNDPQDGEAPDCSDPYALWLAPGVHSPLAARVDTDAGTWFELTNPQYHIVQIDFYDAEGFSIDFQSDTSPLTGEVPEDAEYGILCVDLISQAVRTELDARYTYQDGFIADPAP